MNATIYNWNNVKSAVYDQIKNILRLNAYENNDETTRNKITAYVEAIVQPFKDNECVYDYMIRIDSSEKAVEKNELNLDLAIKEKPGSDFVIVNFKTFHANDLVEISNQNN